MQRFYLSPLGIQNGTVSLTEPRIVYQLNKVLRAGPRDFLHLFNEREGEFLLQIEALEKRKISAKMVQKIENKSEPALKVDLYMAIPKKPALFELVLQKATEIGVNEVIPLITERTQNRRLTKFERLQAIAMEATEQSRRLHIPVIRHPMNYEEALPKMKNPTIAYEYEKALFLSDHVASLKKAKEISLIIGPEGGFSKAEIELAKKHKAKSFTFGPRILRMETAAIAALSLILLNSRN